MSSPFSFAGPIPLRLIEQPANAILDSDPATRLALSAHAGRCIGIEVEDLHFQFLLEIEPQRVRVTGGVAQDADCCLQAASVVFMQLAMEPGNRSLLFGQRMRVYGDTAFAGAVADCLGNLEIDPGALFSPLLGDVVGQGLGQLLGQATGWLRRTGRHLRMDVEEYLENEAGLPSAAEGRQLFTTITEARDSVERLQIRLQRIQDALTKRGERTA